MSQQLALITGGQGDLAEALSRHLISSGFEVLSPGRNELNVLEPGSVKEYFAGLSRLDVLINNAGITGDALFAKQSEKDRNSIIDTNLKGAQLCSQLAAGIMIKKRSGHILNVGSYSAIHPPVGQTAYAAAKAGLIGLTKSYAKEFGKRNVRINCILPGFLKTKMTANMAPEAIETALKRHQLGRFNTVEEAARFVSFICSTENISGQVFQLDSRV
ncbi:MAG: SDR family NAD(P)-dependent oxidoreductase [Verrucomicrobiales bacterium]